MLGIDQLVMCNVEEASLMASDVAEEGTKREEARSASHTQPKN